MLPRISPLLLSIGFAVAAHAEPAPQAIDLFAGDGFTGWTVVANDRTDIGQVCTRTTDGISIAGEPSSYLLTDGSYENYSLSFEYRWPTNATTRIDSGLLLHVAGTTPATGVRPTCFQLQTKSQYVGELRLFGKATFAEPITTPAKGTIPPIRSRQATSSELPPGEWNTVKVICHNGKIEVRVNGVVQNRVTEAEPRAGRIGILLESGTMELRQVRLTPLPAS